MAEILVKAVDAVHPDPVIDRAGSYKRGHMVLVMPDGHPWGLEERLPKFVVIKLPLIAPDLLTKYTEMWLDGSGVPLQRRRWRLLWGSLPLPAQTLLTTVGQLVIRVSPQYTGLYNYDWLTMRQYIFNDQTGLTETVIF